jgi:hypothetical protein
MPSRAAGSGRRARAAAHAVVERFGYLQLDTVSIAGARSHALVLLSRIQGMSPGYPETLLRPGEPLFEYWGHAACWMPLDLYPTFRFRRDDFAKRPKWRAFRGEHRTLERELLARMRNDGPLKSADLEGNDHGPWWDHRPAKRLMVGLWAAGRVAVRERRGFHRSYDLPERVIPDTLLKRRASASDSVRELLYRAIEGHGWAQTGTLAATWMLTNKRREIAAALEELRGQGRIEACALVDGSGKKPRGWIRPEDLELAARLERARPRRDGAVLLSPFDPVLWDRKRVKLLFGFDQILEIFKPAPQRRYGYYCLPVLAGEELLGRIDLKANRGAGVLRALSVHIEPGGSRSEQAVRRDLAHRAIERLAGALGLLPQYGKG